jgi:hypothetical protein
MRNRLARFQREAFGAAELRSTHIVQIGELPKHCGPLVVVAQKYDLRKDSPQQGSHPPRL